jgi:aminotransferase
MDKMLKKAKVAVVPGLELGKYGEGFVRFSYATELSQIKKGFNRMEPVLEKW